MTEIGELQVIDLNERLEKQKAELTKKLQYAIANATYTSIGEDGVIERSIREAVAEAEQTQRLPLDTKIYPKYEDNPDCVVIDGQEAMLYPWLLNKARVLLNVPASELQTAKEKATAAHEFMHLVASFEAEELGKPVLGVKFHRITYQGLPAIAFTAFIHFRGGRMTLEEYYNILEEPDRALGTDPGGASDSIKLSSRNSSPNQKTLPSIKIV